MIIGICKTGQQTTEWFKNIFEGEPLGSLGSAPPIYMTITLPFGDFIELEKEFRKLMKFIKSNSAYTRADGEDLMIFAPEKEKKSARSNSRTVTDGFVEYGCDNNL